MLEVNHGEEKAALLSVNSWQRNLVHFSAQSTYHRSTRVEALLSPGEARALSALLLECAEEAEATRRKFRGT